MKTLFVILTIMAGFALTIYSINNTLVDIVNYTVCDKTRTQVNCHFDKPEFP